jgi:hypothetical protein
MKKYSGTKNKLIGEMMGNVSNSAIAKHIRVSKRE